MLIFPEIRGESWKMGILMIQIKRAKYRLWFLAKLLILQYWLIVFRMTLWMRPSVPYVMTTSSWIIRHGHAPIFQIARLISLKQVRIMFCLVNILSTSRFVFYYSFYLNCQFTYKINLYILLSYIFYFPLISGFLWYVCLSYLFKQYRFNIFSKSKHQTLSPWLSLSTVKNATSTSSQTEQPIQPHNATLPSSQSALPTTPIFQFALSARTDSSSKRPVSWTYSTRPTPFTNFSSQQNIITLSCLNWPNTWESYILDLKNSHKSDLLKNAWFKTKSNFEKSIPNSK